MKIKLVSILTLITVFTCQTIFAQTKPKMKTKVALTVSKIPVKEFSTVVDSVSYAVGVLVAQNFKSQGVTLDPKMVEKGLAAVFSGKVPVISEQACQGVVNSYMMKLQEMTTAEKAKQFLPNKAEGEKFLAENKKKEGVVTLPSGLQYQIIKAGDGPKPLATDKVKTHYHGTLIDGSVFDSSLDRGEPIVFPVNGVIPGWIEALQLMPVGSKWKLFVPQNLAYGTRAAGEKIKPYSTLIFDVELISIEK
ncbi:FKBP-type peptidyl-prolyl cis-trans isomerase [Aquirufa sp. ROCK2-A2]